MNRLINRPPAVGTEPPCTKGWLSKHSLVTLILLTLCLPSIAWTQLSSTTGDLQVNTSTVHSQEYPALAMDNAGNAFAVWQSMATDGSGYGIFARRFDNNGSPLSTEFQVNTTTASNQQSPAVASDASGNTVVVWMSQDQDGDGWGVYGQRYNSAGVAQGSEFLVNNTTAGQQREPQVAMDGNGNFVVVWADNALDGSSMGVFARRFNASATPLANAFQVNTFTTGNQGHPQVAMQASGGFVVTWQSLGQDGSNHGVYFQRYDAAGAAHGSETQAATTTADNQQAPSIGMASNGDFVLTWSSYGQDGSNLGVFGRRFSANGTAQGGEFQVNTTTTASQNQPHVMVAGDGSFAISWSSYGQDGSYAGVYLQAYDATGAATGSESQVNTRTQDFQHASHGAWTDATKNLLLVWMDGLNQSNATHDGDAYGIYLKGFSQAVVAITITAVCQNATLYLDGNGTASLSSADIDGGSSSNAASWGLSLSQSSFSCTDLGSVSVDLIATTGTGLADTCTATVTILDTLNPALTCPANITVGNDPGVCQAVVSYASPVATDNCSAGTPSLVSGLGSGSTFPVGTHTQTWSVSDLSGNTATCSFDITVNDQEAPSLACPADILVTNNAGTCEAIVSYSLPIAADNCTPANNMVLQLTTGLASGASFPTGTTSVTYTTQDQAGNSANCSFNVEVQDNEDPTISCPADIVAPTSPWNCSGLVIYNPPTASDNCGNPTVSLTSGLGSTANFPLGTTTETWTATDQNGNTASCSFNVTIQDNVAPFFNCPGPMVFYTWGGYCFSYVNFPAPTATDNCGSATVAYAGGVGPNQWLAPGNYISSWVATDAAGNQSYCNISIQVIDAQPPTIICPAPIVASAPWYFPGAPVTFNLPVSFDNCGSVSIVQTAGLPSGSFFPFGTTWNTFVSTDVYGNVSTCTFPVTVNVESGGWWFKSDQNDSQGDSPIAAGDEAEVPQEQPQEALILEEPEITAYPNPFQEQANIRFRLPEAAAVTLDVFTMQGQKVETVFQGEVMAGEEREATFKPVGISAGIYYYRLTTDKDYVKTGKLIYQH